MSIDVRTRTDHDPGTGAVPPLDVDELLGRTLPAQLAARPPMAPPPGGRALRPLTLDVDGRPWTLRSEDGRATLAPGRPAGDERRAEVRLTAAALADLVDDQVTPVGWLTAGTLDMPAGQIGHLLDWWLVLRSTLDDRPMHEAGALAVPAGPARAFTLDDDPAQLHAHLAEAGYLHLEGVFGADEMAQISDDMDAAVAAYAPGDGQSWWARTEDGSPDGAERLVRMQGFERHSPTTAALLDDPRFTGLGALGGGDHVHTGLPGNRVEALFKPLGVRQGISDVPWHKDCSLGRHSYECCSLTVGVSITGAGPTTGQLRVIAGSHRALVWPALLDPADLGLPEVALPTSTGDVTVHLSCTLHMAEPPTTAERRVLYTSFRLPQRAPDAAETARRRLLAAAREQAPLTTSQAVAPGSAG